MSTSTPIPADTVINAIGNANGVITGLASPDSLTAHQAYNFAAQAFTILGGIAASSLGLLGGAIGVTANAIALKTNTNVLEDDTTILGNDYNNTGATTPAERLSVAGDWITQIGDGMGVATAILNQFPGTKPSAIALTVFSNYLVIAGQALSDASIANNIVTTYGNDIINSAESEITSLQNGISKYSSEIGSFLGATWASFVSALTTSLNDVQLLLSNLNGANFVTYANQALSSYATIDSTISNMFSASGASAQSVTEDASAAPVTIGGVAVTISNAANSYSIAQNVTFDAASYSIGGSYNVSGSTTGGLLSASGTSTFNPLGIETSALSVTSGSGMGSLNLTASGSGLVSQQLQLDGINLVAPVSQPSNVNVGGDGTTFLEISSPTPGNQVTIQRESDGSTQVIVGDPEQVMEFAPGSLSGGTIDVSQDMNGTIDITTNIEAGAATDVEFDQTYSNVKAFFDFTGDNEVFQIGTVGAFFGTISDFAPSDTIDLDGVAGASLSLAASNVLEVNQTGAASLPIDFDPNQDLADSTFSVAPDGAGGADITLGGISVTSIVAPSSTFTVVDGINNSATTVGYFSGASGYQAFIDSNNIFSTINVPASVGSFTWFSDVNDEGQVSGQYFNSQGTYTPFVESGGTFNAFSVPGAKSTWTTGINDSGQVVGYAVSNLSQIFGGYFYSYLESGGGSTILNVPGSASTKANGI